ncbi:MAG: PAS domain S-box protein, partial [Gammaproteobacteria bacterium]|nr:PAS domain S-box protein [Gammaproteobacteria bacterium]
MPRINSDIPLQALIKRFSFIYLPIATLLTIILLLAVRFDNDLRIERTKVREASRIEVATGRIKQDLSAVETDLRIIASLPVLQTYLDHGSSIQRAELEKYFLVMARESRRYDQIRYLNTSGQEVIRINYNNGQPVIVQHAQLENKSGRYYFRKSIKLNQGEVFISPLDLNIEQDRLEIPYKPMIRYGAAVFDSAGHKQGIVFINYLGNELLQNFRQVMQGGDSPDGVLLNHDGFWLASDNRDDEWGFMLGKKERTFGHDFPEVWQTLSSSDRGSLLTNQGLFVYATVSVLVGVQHVPADFGSAHSDSELEHEHSADWKIVTFVPNSVFSAASLYNLPGSRILMVAAYLLLALGSFFVARVTLSRQQARQEILQLNVELEKRAAAHAEGEENLSVTLNSIGDAVIATDIEGRVTRMNRVAEQLTGWLRAEAIGHPVADIFHIINQHTRQPATIPVSTTLAQGVIQGLANDTLLLARDGRECAIADSCAPIRQRDGKVIGAVLVFRDVTSEYTAQSALRDSEERYRTLFEQMDEGFCVVEMLYDSNGKATDYRFIEINPMFEKQTGLREALGKTIRQLVPDHDAHWFEIYGEVARTGTAIRFENPANAMQRYYDVFAFRIGGDGSRRVGILFKDITENNLAQKALNDSATRIQTILNTVADGIITINQHGIVEMFNPAAEHLFGYAASEVIGQNVKMLMPEPYHSQHDGYLQHYLTTGEVRILGTSREVVGLRRDGSTFPMYLAINNMKLGEQYYFTGVVHDLSASKQAEKLLQLAKEKAELANRAKDSFLATMSHEIRTPLTGMLGMLEVLSLTPLNHDQEETLRAAWDSSRSLLRIVSDILDWSKIEAGKLHLAPLSTSIPQLLQEVINTYSRVASAKSLVLRQIVDARLSRAHIVDGLRLSQVLNNFISNAIKFTHSGEIELRAELLDQVESGERIRFSVKDTGIGIARDAQHRLFRRYQQESMDTARRFGGTGLGLAICQSLVDLMDGQIDLVSVPGE